VIRTIIKREFLDNILSFKSIACVLVAIILTTVSTVFLTSDYQLRLKDYRAGVTLKEKNLEQVPVYSYLATSAFGLKYFYPFVKQISRDENPSSPFQFNIRSITNKPIDYYSVPIFEEKEIKPGDRIINALPYISLLVLYNLILFARIFYKFQSYDVQ